MGKYVVALYCDLCKQSDAWNEIPRDQMAGLLGEYKAIAEELATRYGSLHRNFVGDGHLVLFENADAAVQFGLKLIRAWHEEFGASPAVERLRPIPLRVGAHFGESMQIGTSDAWVGRANNIANRIQGAAEPDTILVSEGMLDLIDLPLYQVEPVDPCELRGDCVARRTLYRVVGFDEARYAAKSAHELTAEDWFLRAVAMIGTAKEGGEEEEHCYVQALRLRPEFPEAHFNYAILLKERADLGGAEEHYMEALRLDPEDAGVHNNYAILLKQRGDLEGAEEHYTEALRLDPEQAVVHYNYANLLADGPGLDRAEHHYREALRLRPRDAAAHYNCALLLRRRGDVEAAEEHYRRAYDLSPDDPEIKRAFEGRAWEH